MRRGMWNYELPWWVDAACRRYVPTSRSVANNSRQIGSGTGVVSNLFFAATSLTHPTWTLDPKLDPNRSESMAFWSSFSSPLGGLARSVSIAAGRFWTPKHDPMKESASDCQLEYIVLSDSKFNIGLGMPVAMDAGTSSVTAVRSSNPGS